MNHERIEFVNVDDLSDSRLDVYRDIRDRDLLGESGRPGLFIGEQALTVEKMLSIPGMTQSMLITPNWRGRFERFAGADPETSIPAFIVPQEAMDQVVGFHIHRGVLAVGRRPDSRRVSDVVPRGKGHSTLLAAESITNIDNVGLLFRNAAAFAVDAVILSPDCHDPLYRKSIRVSIGHVLSVPWARAIDWPGDLRYCRELGFTLIAAAVGADAVDIDTIPVPDRSVVVVGSEFHGLSEEVVGFCDHVARIPMARGIDSLNVAVASAVCLHRFSRGIRE